MSWIKKLFSTKKRIAFVLLLILIFFVGKYFLIDSKKVISDSAIVKKGDIKEELTLSGKIYAEDHVILRFGIAGKVDWIGVKKGDWVKKGQAIATIEKERYEAALRQAWQDFTAAKAASDKYYDGRNSTESESYDQKITRTTLDAAQNKAYDNIRIAQENLKSVVLYSPIDGLLVSVDPDHAGANITATNYSYEVVNPSTIYLKVTADQTEVGELKNGQVGIIVFDSYLGEKVQGSIKDISFAPTKDETGTVYDVRVDFGNSENKYYKYRLDMTADITFVIKEKKNAIMIPSGYIKSDDRGKFVLIGKDKKKTYIKTGIENEQDTEVTKGLSEGDVVYD